MSNITDLCHWNCAHELISKTWKLYLDQSNDVAIAEGSHGCIIVFEITVFFVLIVYDEKFGIKSFEHTVRESSGMIGSMMTSVSTFNLSSIDEVEVGCHDGKTLSTERWECLDIILILVHQMVDEFQFGFPCDIAFVEIQDLINEP